MLRMIARYELFPEGKTTSTKLDHSLKHLSEGNKYAIVLLHSQKAAIQDGKAEQHIWQISGRVCGEEHKASPHKHGREGPRSGGHKAARTMICSELTQATVHRHGFPIHRLALVAQGHKSTSSPCLLALLGRLAGAWKRGGNRSLCYP